MAAESGLQQINLSFCQRPPWQHLLLPSCLPLSDSSLCTHPPIKRVVHRVQEHCAESSPPEMPSLTPGGIASLSLPLPPLFSRFLLPFIKKGQKPALFAVSSYWSSIHINNSSGRIMYTKACSNVPHSKSNWLLRTFVELLLSHRHLKRRKPGPILSPACYSFQKLWWYYLRQAGRRKIEWKKEKKEIKKVRKKENKTFLLPAKRI